jgi:hypothetical protein
LESVGHLVVDRRSFVVGKAACSAHRRLPTDA